MKMAGFSLLEMLIAMALSGVLMLSAGRFLPLLLRENLKMQQRVQLRQELQQMMDSLTKAVRRAGYCHGECGKNGLIIATDCLLLRWDENSNGKWEGVGQNESDFHGFRLRQKQLEVQRGVDSCDGTGWERLSDPAFLTIEQFDIIRQGRNVKLQLQARAGDGREQLESWVTGENL